MEGISHDVPLLDGAPAAPGGDGHHPNLVQQAFRALPQADDPGWREFRMTYQELLELKHKRAEKVAKGKELLAKDPGDNVLRNRVAAVGLHALLHHVSRRLGRPEAIPGRLREGLRRWPRARSCWPRRIWRGTRP